MVGVKQGCPLSGFYIDEICNVTERLASSGAWLVVVAILILLYADDMLISEILKRDYKDIKMR